MAVILRKNSELGYSPDESELEVGELVANTGDGVLYLKTESGIIKSYFPEARVAESVTARNVALQWFTR
jgi:hypothetical protein